MKDIVFMGSKEIGYSCLEYLLQQSGKLNVRVQAVLTNNRSLFEGGATIPALCREYDIPILGSLDEFLESNDCDILISVQYHEILKAQHIKKARQIAVNLHMAPVPEYRGCNQFSFAILDDAKEFGTTLHQLEVSIDGGAILFERRFPIPERCHVKHLYELTFQESEALFQASLKDLIQGNYDPVPQSKFDGQRASGFHYRKEIEAIKKIDLVWPEERIDRHFRATWFPPFPPPYAIIDGEKVELQENWRELLK